MNIVTGAKGFIGNHFACTVDKPLEVDIDNCFELLNKFNRWKDVDMIIHMGAAFALTQGLPLFVRALFCSMPVLWPAFPAKRKQPPARLVARWAPQTKPNSTAAG